MLFFRLFNPHKHTISPLTCKIKSRFSKIRLRKQIIMKLKEKDSNYPKQQNFLEVIHKTNLQNINKGIKRWKTKT